MKAEEEREREGGESNFKGEDGMKRIGSKEATLLQRTGCWALRTFVNGLDTSTWAKENLEDEEKKEEVVGWRLLIADCYATGTRKRPG